MSSGGGFFIYFSQGSAPGEYSSSPPQHPLTACSSLGRGGALLAPHQSSTWSHLHQYEGVWTGPVLGRSCAGKAIVAVSSWAQQTVMSGRQCLQHSLLYIPSSQPPSKMSQALEKGYIDVPLEAEHPAVTFSQHFDHLGVSAVIISCCKQKLPIEAEGGTSPCI